MSEPTPDETPTCHFSSWNNDLRCWAQGMSGHIKAITTHGDPVELSCDQLEALIEALTTILNEIR